jgi:hypothetical protein
MSTKVRCCGCGFLVDFDGKEMCCPKCGDVISDSLTLLDSNLLERLNMAASFRRVGNFEDSQRELENLLEINPDMVEALFGCFLNSYEVTEYAFQQDNTVKLCKCFSTSKRPVERDKDWQDVKEKTAGIRGKQWTALSEEIEEQRQCNIKVRDSIPSYRAILLYDYTNSSDADVAYAIYKKISKKVDIFFPPESLKNIAFEERERYLIQILKNPELSPLLFVVYSDSFNFRKRNMVYYNNLARQCQDFAEVHTKNELISITSDYEPPAMIKRISTQTIICEFREDKYDKLSDLIYESIVDYLYYQGGDDLDDGVPKKLNGDYCSPLVKKL